MHGLRDALALMEADIARELMPIRGDRLFHVRVAEASENAALLRVVTELYDERNNPLFERLGRHFERVGTWRQAVAEHRLVVTAIAAQDPTRARAAMHEHLQRSHDRFGAAWAGGDPAIRAAPNRRPHESRTAVRRTNSPSGGTVRSTKGAE